MTTPAKPRRHARRPRGSKKGRNAGSTMFTRRVRDARALTSSLDQYKNKVAAGLGEVLAPGLLGEETLPDHSLTLDLVARSAETALEDLTDAHRSYVRQTTLCHNLSLECDRLADEELYPRAVDLRRSIDGVFGKRQAALIHGFQGRIPTWREGLREQIGRTLQFLQDPRSEMPEPKVPGFVAARTDWIRLIKPPFEALEERLDELTRQNLERQLLGDARRRAMEAFDERLQKARSLAEALFAMAGLSERPRKHLRADYERRWLSRWARQRRMARQLAAEKAGAAAVAAAGPHRGAAAKASGFARMAAWLAKRFQSS